MCLATSVYLVGWFLRHIAPPQLGFPRSSLFQEKRQLLAFRGFGKLHHEPRKSLPPHWIQQPGINIQIASVKKTIQDQKHILKTLHHDHDSCGWYHTENPKDDILDPKTVFTQIQPLLQWIITIPCVYCRLVRTAAAVITVQTVLYSRSAIHSTVIINIQSILIVNV